MATGRLPDPNTAPVTAKGDLYTYSTVPAKLAVGNSGETLVADSSATTGLRWQGNYEAGKNKVINGDFFINQRAFTSVTANATYTYDRWKTTIVNGGGTVTVTPQTFTPGAAPVAGYEGKNYLQMVTAGMSTSASLAQMNNNIEDVRTFAGQTITVSFWAKAASGTPFILGYVMQNFGTGGSPSAEVFTTGTAKQAITTSWARYSFVINVPSISGKTIGTDVNSSYTAIRFVVSSGSDYDALIGAFGVQNNTFQIWGVQAENGSVATAFQTATGTLAGELAACQRYYYRTVYSNSGDTYCVAIGTAATTSEGFFQNPVYMRTNPTSIEFANLRLSDRVGNDFTVTNLTTNSATRSGVRVNITTGTGITSSRPYFLIGDSTAGYIGLNAEL